MKILNKKAEFNVYFAIIDLILVVTASLIIFNFINSISANTIFERKFIAEDVALLTGTITALPGNTNYVYDEKNSKNFSIIITDGFVVVSDKNKDSFPVFTDKNIRYIISKKSKNEVLFIKKDNSNIYFGSEQKAEENNNKEECIDIDTKGDIRKKILAIEYTEESKPFANMLAAKLKTSFLAVKEKEAKENTGLVDLSLIIETSQDKGIKIYYNGEKGKKLSCILKNKIRNIAEIKSIVYQQDNSLGNKLKIRISLGKDTKAKEEAIITAIDIGIKEYYS